MSEIEGENRDLRERTPWREHNDRCNECGRGGGSSLKMGDRLRWMGREHGVRGEMGNGVVVGDISDWGRDKEARKVHMERKK